MKLLLAASLLAAAASAFVIPDEDMKAQFVLENKHPDRSGFEIGSFHDLRAELASLISGAKKTVKCHGKKVEEFVEPFADAPWEAAEAVVNKAKAWTHEFDFDPWFESDDSEFMSDDIEWGPPHRDDGESPEDGPPHHEPPHHGPPHDGPPHHGRPPHHRPPHHKRPHKRPDFHNYTIWQVISHSNYTTKFAHFASEYSDIVKVLNSTKANHTLFVPTNKAFEHLHGNYTPPKWFIEKVLEYHISPGLYPAGRVLVTPTIPTLLNDKFLGNNSQRTRVSLGLKGVTLNFEVGVYPVNIETKNGIIHALDKILLPPPPTIHIIKALPQVFSTLELALHKANLTPSDIPTHPTGYTVFAPSNTAWARLPPRVLTFLFSKYGQKYLKALVKYHAAPDKTLYSNAFYDSDKKDQGFPERKYFHVDLQTNLGPPVAVDVKRWGLWTSITINGFTNVAVRDFVALDSNIHIINSILIPPRKPGLAPMPADAELTVEELKSRFDIEDDEEVESDFAWAQSDL